MFRRRGFLKTSIALLIAPLSMLVPKPRGWKYADNGDILVFTDAIVDTNGVLRDSYGNAIPLGDESTIRFVNGDASGIR